MSFFKRIFSAGNETPEASASSQPASHFPGSSQQSESPMAQQNASRRELLRLVLRDTLNRTGIPTSWVGADLLAATSRGREPGIPVRFLIKHWDPRLMLHGIAFQNAYKKRVLTLEPQAERWLIGISWQFSLPDDSLCPPMPHPGIWTSSIPSAALAGVDTAELNPEHADLLGGSIVISGPAASSDSSAARSAAAAARVPPRETVDPRAEAKADLERLFAVRDEDLKRAQIATNDSSDFAATEPAPLPEPMGATAFEPTQASNVDNLFAKTDVFRRPARPAATPEKK